MNTEGGRIARLQQDAQSCAVAEALKRARAISRTAAPPCSRVGREAVLPAQIPPESSYLEAKHAGCSGFVSPSACVPSSVRTASIEQCTVQKATDPTNPDARFSAYVRVFPTPCPPVVFTTPVGDVPPLGANKSGNPPAIQGKVCALPNKPDNPVLPG